MPSMKSILWNHFYGSLKLKDLAALEECQKQNGITSRNRMTSERRPVCLAVSGSIKPAGDPAHVASVVRQVRGSPGI